MTKKILINFLLGFLLWFILFIIGFAIFPLYDSQKMLYKSVMIISSVFLGIIFIGLYFKKIKNNFFIEGLLTGTIWFVVNFILYQVLMDFSDRHY